MANTEMVVGKANGYRTIPFREPQKTWAVIRGDAIFRLFLVCSAGWMYIIAGHSPTTSNNTKYPPWWLV